MLQFLTNNQAAEKIAGLEARVNELEGELTTAHETIETLQGEAANHSESISALTTERDEAATKLATATATIEEQEKTITAANDKLATFDTEVAKAARNEVAGLGFTGEIPGSKADASSKPDHSNLKGLEKAIAIHKSKK